MDTSVRTFLDYLLDVETTSDVTFNEEVLRNDQFYHKHYLSDFEQIVENKLKQWKDFDQKEPSAIVNKSAKKSQSGTTNDESDDESENDEITEAQQDAAIQDLEGTEVH